jgi:hypothetical protein
VVVRIKVLAKVLAKVVIRIRVALSTEGVVTSHAIFVTKMGHYARDCAKKRSNQGRERQESANVTRTNEIALIGAEQQISSNL